ncbi:MAG: hypothetical protein ACXITV_10895 [Luteibaculaceae bacterium]
MYSLSNTWITDQPIDFELKKYQLLAWLQSTNKAFTALQIYPSLSDLIYQFNNLNTLKEEKKLMIDKFPKKLQSIDLAELKLNFTQLKSNSSYLEQIDEVIEFAMPEIEQEIKSGKELYQTVYNFMDIEPLGIIPLYKDEGYAFLHFTQSKQLSIYRYRSSMFTSSTDAFRGISFQYIETRKNNASISVDSIKRELTKSFNDLPNPATFLVTFNQLVPVEQTAVPLSKQKLLRYLASF